LGVKGIALLLLDLGTRRGEWSEPRPGRFTPGKDPVLIGLGRDNIKTSLERIGHNSMDRVRGSLLFNAIKYVGVL
jgi:hypothetical protein